MNTERIRTRWALTALAAGWIAQAPAQTVPQIVDRDSDGLIEINNLDDLNEIRNDLLGRTLRGSSGGCPASGCFGYELTRDLDFDTNGNGTLDAGDWNLGRAWTPIQGTRTGVPLDENRFRAEFNGNGHAIRTMRLRQITNVHDYGLFGVVTGAFIRDLRLTGVDVNIFGHANYQVGSLAGRAVDSAIRFVSVEGTVISDSRHEMGGVLGAMLHSGLHNSDFSGQVAHIGANDAHSNVGGLVGQAQSSLVFGCSARGRVSGAYVAGLVEDASATGIRHSYSNVDVVGLSSASGLVNRARYQTAGVDIHVQSNPDYYTLQENYSLGSVRTGTGAGAGLIGNLSLYDGVTVTLRNSYSRNRITHSTTGAQWANLVQVLNGSGLIAGDNYWVTDPTGAILPSNLTLPAGSPLANGGQLLADMQCATRDSDNGCAAPLLFQNWAADFWDFGTTTELPALRLLVSHGWISTDSPNATGDHESMSKLRAGAPSESCDNPVQLSAKEMNSAYVFQTHPGDDVLDTFSATEGLRCLNSQQADGTCVDYRTRFLCDESSSQGSVYWTSWSSRDTASSGDGDDERVASTLACGAGTKTGIQVSDLQGLNLRQGPPRKLRTFSSTRGLVCLNADGKCRNYQVRMICTVSGDR